MKDTPPHLKALKEIERGRHLWPRRGTPRGERGRPLCPVGHDRLAQGLQPSRLETSGYR